MRDRIVMLDARCVTDRSGHVSRVTHHDDASLSAGGRKYDDVAQVSKPAVSRISKSASAMTKDGLPTGKSAIQQVWKPALQNTSPNLRPGALRSVRRSRCPNFRQSGAFRDAVPM